jgi:hypothetical protein
MANKNYPKITAFTKKGKKLLLKAKSLQFQIDAERVLAVILREANNTVVIQADNKNKNKQPVLVPILKSSGMLKLKIDAKKIRKIPPLTVDKSWELMFKIWYGE